MVHLVDCTSVLRQQWAIGHSPRWYYAVGCSLSCVLLEISESLIFVAVSSFRGFSFLNFPPSILQEVLSALSYEHRLYNENMV